MFYDPNASSVVIVKVFESLLYVFAAKKIYEIGKYIVNKMFALNFLIWAAYLISDALIMTFGVASPEIFQFANIMHKLQLIMAVGNAVIMYRCSEIVLHSVRNMEAKTVAIRMVIFLVVSIAIFANVELGVIDTQTDMPIPPRDLPSDLNVMVVIIYRDPIVSYLTLPIPILMYILAVLKLYSITKSETDEINKKKMMYVLLGMLLIPVGYVYFFIVTSLVQNLSFGVRMIGHLFWASSPILIVTAYTKKEFNEKQNGEPDKSSQ